MSASVHTANKVSSIEKLKNLKPGVICEVHRNLKLKLLLTGEVERFPANSSEEDVYTFTATYIVVKNNIDEITNIKNSWVFTRSRLIELDSENHGEYAEEKDVAGFYSVPEEFAKHQFFYSIFPCVYDRGDGSFMFKLVEDHGDEVARILFRL